MENKPKFEISDWKDAPLRIHGRPGVPPRLISPALAGVFGTIFIHVLILPSTYIGTRLQKAHHLEIQEDGGALGRSTEDVGENLVLINVPTASQNNPATEPISLLQPLSQSMLNSKSIPDPPQLPNLETLTIDDDQQSASSGAGDAAKQARLFGIYTGQILARINRIWRRPRSPVSESVISDTVADASFQCEAQVIQDDNDKVQEILLPRCNGSPAWQRSLVLAIQQSSPLPAPPSPSVFTRSVTLTFVGVPYFTGANEDDYEMPPPKIVPFRTRTQ